MYKLQVYNAETQEILREKTYKKPDLIQSLLESAEKGQECFLFDEECKTYKGDYVTHSNSTEEDFEVYKVYFQVELSDIQARFIN
ncbi:hypothetical protein [Bacillus benzoevorans]|uniref:Uncharacterized protein n=1 Tax=Bacillus benzoevorans TaxID=1456 RepID=A0A7X0HV52_9BACI|nr:hypothetical protein [Bacillus benzoevorans]MBB6447413.1 hypothetical protein [Bacillus benzoevorans]